MDPATVALVGAGAVVAVVGTPLALGAAGFTAGGIVAGSLAAKMMSLSAVASGGGVLAGSLVSLCQIIGAVGLSSATVAVAGVGAAGGWVVSLLV